MVTQPPYSGSPAARRPPSDLLCIRQSQAHASISACTAPRSARRPAVAGGRLARQTGGGGTDMSDRPAPWSEIAAWYDDLVTAGSGPHETAVGCLLRLVPELAGLAVLDRARGYPAPTGVSYRVDDAERLSSCADASFDGVTCQLGLMDIGDLAAAVHAVARVLRPAGWFVLVIGHPCFLAPGASTAEGPGGVPGRLITGYLGEGFWRSGNPHGIRGRAGNYHRTLSTYLNTLAGAGFVVAAVDEPRASALLLAEQPVYEHLPIFLGLRAHLGERRRHELSAPTAGDAGVPVYER